MAARKLKRKIWVLSLVTTIVSIGIMMYIPSIYFQVLPILIPASIITVIMPTYFLEQNEPLNVKNKTKNINNTISENSIKIKEEKQTEKSKDIVDEISEDQTLSLKEKKVMLQILKQEEIKKTTNDKKYNYHL